MKHFNISDRKNLLLKVYVFGYPIRGESVLVLFIDKGYNNKVLYSMVIDCFKYKGANKTVDIMSAYGLKEQKIDMLIWSHPDYDHTFGIDTILNQFCSKDTIVVLPYDLNGEAWNKVSYNQDDKKIVHKILKLTKRKQLSHETIAVPDKSYVPFPLLVFDDLIGELPVAISALSPHGRRINYLIEEHKTMHKNDLSISIIMEVGKKCKYQLLFMADTENNDIEMIDSDIINNLVFVKIPHHTSTTSDLMCKLIKNTCGNLYISCSTIYKSHKLPERDLLKDYMVFSSQTDCTGFPKGKEKEYGFIEYTFDFYGEKKIYVSHKGHASIVDRDFLNSMPY